MDYGDFHESEVCSRRRFAGSDFRSRFCSTGQSTAAPGKSTAAASSKADVEKLVASIKADKAKRMHSALAIKLDEEAHQASEKNDQKKVEELSKQIDEAAKKISPDFDRIMSTLDQTTSLPLEELAKSCKK